MHLKRSSGILLHPTSLPGRFNIGDFGPSARKFVDLLSDAKQSWWQTLPLTPPGFGGSPYGSTSSFAINLGLIDPLWLLDKGWISNEDLTKFEESQPLEGEINALANAKQALLYTAYDRWQKRAKSTEFSEFARFAEEQKSFASFKEKNQSWLPDDALFFALKSEFDNAPWIQWPQPLLTRQKEAIEQAKIKLKANIERYIFAQWVADTQWQELRNYAKNKGIQFIGDLPIFVALDSSDVWARREVFEVNEHGEYHVVAGVPPDYFSADGQKWGNPLYRWHDRFQTVMHWWIERVKRAQDLVDLIRIDHFRAFADYWEVPAQAPNAREGSWKQGPGDPFFEKIKEALGSVPFIAEDLGIVSEQVYQLRDRHNLPGMKILEFAFNGDPEHPFLPHTYPERCVAYPGTHDNNTIVGWRDNDASDHELYHAQVYLSSPREDLPEKMMIALQDSSAILVIFQVQDIFQLPASSRMNTPGKPEGNWTWRMTPEMLDTTLPETQHVWNWLKEITLDGARA